jgi:hypothetical protein
VQRREQEAEEARQRAGAHLSASLGQLAYKGVGQEGIRRVGGNGPRQHASAATRFVNPLAGASVQKVGAVRLVCTISSAVVASFTSCGLVYSFQCSLLSMLICTSWSHVAVCLASASANSRPVCQGSRHQQLQAHAVLRTAAANTCSPAHSMACPSMSFMSFCHT